MVSWSQYGYSRYYRISGAGLAMRIGRRSELEILSSCASAGPLVNYEQVLFEVESAQIANSYA
eukprot:jgi/Botrbrau1/19009/Bobra.0100s0041.1